MLIDVILRISDQIASKKELPEPGHNGPYKHTETPVRVSSHWLITLIYCYKWTGLNKYLFKAEQLLNFLLSESARPHNYSFFHRISKKNDQCNGLIGQAWTIEALCEAAKFFEEDKIYQVAEEVFLHHNFNKEHGLWYRLEVDGKILSIDLTFNHQLWFASSGSLIKSNNSEINNLINIFLNKLDRNLSIYNDGLISHPIYGLFNKNEGLLKTSPEIMKKINQGIYKFMNLYLHNIGLYDTNKIHYKSIGYHSFNLYAFKNLINFFQNHKFWVSKTYKKIKQYLLKNKFFNKLDKNIYGYYYNPPGFEIPYIFYSDELISESDFLEFANKWINIQFEKTFNFKTYKFDKNNPDPNTLTARIYEITRLPFHILEKINIPLYK